MTAAPIVEGSVPPRIAKCECDRCLGGLTAPLPMPMVLWCPECGQPHVDQLEPDGQDWSKIPHKKHLCAPERGGCGFVWQPALIHTVGVAPALITERVVGL